MDIEYVTSEDMERRDREIIASLSETQKSKYIFNDEPFYLIGTGHDFVYSFFNEYITKSGIKACQYLYSGSWSINGDKYKYAYESDTFIKIEIVIEDRKIDFDNMTFPVVRKIPGSIADKLESVIPTTKPTTKKPNK